MNLEQLRDFCLALPGTTEAMPFGEETLVFKVKDKIFLLTSLDAEKLSFNVKCEPEKAQELRERYPFVQPGYHMNKKHWNTITAESSVHDDLYLDWIRHSYDRVVAGLPSKQRAELLTNQ
ncbi:MmcQ/YjbR family DNA-binding protein [Salmonirosea aquatica]|uniref:MmcQ/YjbR family DNA-binding protein n=1 Tax=Salmonirosea aquatica TaxID=2654236 RepID=A0A7C9FZX9_9BACT|nr:MmcQ/YjbR family DNA-binding protein [Cytophagaceae bacterium SJW1-29]